MHRISFVTTPVALLALLSLSSTAQAQTCDIELTGAELAATAGIQFPTRTGTVDGSALVFAPGDNQSTLVRIPLAAAGALSSDSFVQVNATVSRTRLQADDDLDVAVTAGSASIGVAAQDNFGGILIGYQMSTDGAHYSWAGEQFLTGTGGVGSALPPLGAGAFEYDMTVTLGCDSTTAAGTWGTESGSHTFGVSLPREEGVFLDILSEYGVEAYRIESVCIDVDVVDFAAACDMCTSEDCADTDGDGIEDSADTCPLTADPDQADADHDGAGDVCDTCPADAANDADGDGVCESADNCDVDANPHQADADGDGAGDVCDADDDDDGAPDLSDNCPYDHNPGQADADADGIGDACDDDSDNDGLIDADDQCLGTAPGEPVDVQGCAIDQLCPCDHPSGAAKWKNHGAYVSCVAGEAGDLVADGLLSGAEEGATVSEAARSSCGHKAR